MNEKEIYEKKLEGQLEEWRATIDKYKAKAKQASGEAQAEYLKQVNALEARQESAKEKLNDFKSKSGDAWEDMKAGMENAWLSLKNAVNSATSRFDN